MEIAEDFRQRNSQLFHSVEIIKLSRRGTTSEARNEGVKRAIPNSYLFFLDSDVILKPTTLTELQDLIEGDPEIGAVGKLYLTLNPSLFEKTMYYRYLGKVYAGPAGTGALLVKPEVIEEVGLFNENLGYPKTVYEDLEYVMRIRRAGYKVLIDGRNPLLHFKPPQEDSQGRKTYMNLMNIVRHFLTYLSFNKAYALYEVLKSAPTVFKLEYLSYSLIILTLGVTSLLLPVFSFLTLFLLLAIASAYSAISYRGKLEVTLRLLAGPAILVTRLLRALTLTLFVIYSFSKSSLNKLSATLWRRHERLAQLSSKLF